MTAGAITVPTIIPLRAPQPGKLKTAIDSNTKIEMRSDTPNTDIYYTLNGSAPEPYQRLGTGQKVTIKYKAPFVIPAGKRTLKAIAVTKEGDGRMSNVVTKMFDVEYIEPEPLPRDNDDSMNFLDEIQEERVKTYPGLKYSTNKKERQEMMSKMMSQGSRNAWGDGDLAETESRLTDMMVSGSSGRKPRTGTRFMNTRFEGVSESDHVTIGQGTVANQSLSGESLYRDSQLSPRSMRRHPPHNSTQALRLQRETDFLKCVYCFAPRPSDPYARFCNDCGKPVPALPHTRLPPPEPGQMGMCVHCNSMVPFNTSICVICEAPIPNQNTPQASVKLTDKLLCPVCGTANPCNMQSCVVCEARLPTTGKAVHYGSMAPPLPSQDGRLITCTKCGRVNNSDARFCDWCGAKPGLNTQSLICSKCHASNQPYAKYCASCAVTLSPPVRLDPRNSAMSNGYTPGSLTSDPQWLPVAYPSPDDLPKPKTTTATQTVGLFYPSERELIKKQLLDDDRLALEKQMRDRKPLLTAVSPGRGYWRKQMEHMCSHMKVYAQNNTEFRALVGEPRMGKIVSASVHEDGYELSLSVNFALKGNQDPYKGTQLTNQDFLSHHTQGRRGSLDTIETESIVSERSITTGKRRKKKKIVKKKIEDRLSKQDKALLREVGKNGEGNITEVQQLVDEGADVNCLNKDDVPVLHVAVLHKHTDIIPVLIQAGARVGEKGPTKGNTALHEAISLGTSGKEVIDTLLGCGANPNKKNTKGESAYDLAVKSGHESLVKKLAAHLGQSQLDKLTKPKTHSSEKMF